MINPEQRNIFEYNNGSKACYADPIRLSHKLATAYPKESNLEHDFKLLKLQNNESFEALIRIADFARDVFNLKSYDKVEGQSIGVTDTEAIGVLVDFTAWMDTVKKNMNVQPISPSPTEHLSWEK